MNKKVSIVIVISIIIASILYGVAKWSQYSNTEVIQEVEVKLLPSDVGELNKIELYNGTLMTLKRGEEGWENITYPTLNMDDTKVDQLINELNDAQAFYKVKNAQDIEKYGIDEYAKLITCYTADTEVYTFRIGSKVANEAARYIWSDMDDTLYIVEENQIERLLEDQNTLIDVTIPGLEMPIVEMEISASNQTPIQISLQEGYWEIEGLFNNTRILKDEYALHCIEVIQQLEKVAFVAQQQEDMTEYGLEDPYLIIDVNNQLTLKIGNQIDGYRYLAIDEESYIYTVEALSLEDLSIDKPFEVIEKTIYMPKLEEIQHITVQKGEEQVDWFFEEVRATLNEQIIENEEEKVTEDIVFDEENVVIEDKEEDSLEDGTYIVSYINGVIVDEQVTQELLMQLNGITLSNMLVNPELENKQNRKADIIIVYEMKDGTQKTLEFVPYDPSLYLLREDGYIEFGVDKAEVLAATSPFFEFYH